MFLQKHTVLKWVHSRGAACGVVCREWLRTRASVGGQAHRQWSWPQFAVYLVESVLHQEACYIPGGRRKPSKKARVALICVVSSCPLLISGRWRRGGMSILSAGFLLVYFFPLEWITAFNLFHYKNLEFSNYQRTREYYRRLGEHRKYYRWASSMVLPLTSYLLSSEPTCSEMS